MITKNERLRRCAVRRQGETGGLPRIVRRWPAFRRDEAGATTAEFVVVTALVVGLAGAVAAGVAGGAQSGADKMAKCMKIQGKLMGKDISYEKRLKRMQKRCAKL